MDKTKNYEEKSVFMSIVKLLFSKLKSANIKDNIIGVSGCPMTSSITIPIIKFHDPLLDKKTSLERFDNTIVVGNTGACKKNKIVPLKEFDFAYLPKKWYSILRYTDENGNELVNFYYIL